MIAEVVKRRFNHPEWETPDLFIVDGGKGQVTAAVQTLGVILNERKQTGESLSIPIVGLAKRFEEIIVPQGNNWKVIRIPYTSGALHVMQRIRDEAHRFAITYHRLLRKKAFVTIKAT